MLDGDADRIRMAYSLMFSLPGTPVLFYGEEIGMGEDLRQKGRARRPHAHAVDGDEERWLLQREGVRAGGPSWRAMGVRPGKDQRGQRQTGSRSRCGTSSSR
jgi:glycosidase